MGLRFLSQALFYDKIKLNHLNIKQIRTTRLLQAPGSDYIDLVPLTGLEPVRSLNRGILSPLRLPIPPQRRNILSLLLIIANAKRNVNNFSARAATFCQKLFSL